MERHKVVDVRAFLRGFKIPEEQAKKLKSDTGEPIFRQTEPITNVRSKIAGLARAYAAAAVAAAAGPPPQQEQNGQPGPSNAPAEPNHAAVQMPRESLQGSAGPAPKTAVEAARDVVSAMAQALGGGEGSPSKSGDGARISPLGARIPATQQQEQQHEEEEEPESSAGKRREAAETEAMLPPPLPQQQVVTSQAGGEAGGFLLPTQPQYLGTTDGTGSMDIDYGPGNQGGGNVFINDDEEEEAAVAAGEDEGQDFDIAQLPITQPIPYGGTPPEALNKVVSMQGEAVYGGEEAEQISPAKAGAVAATVASEEEGEEAAAQQQEEEEGERREKLISPKARAWMPSINAISNFWKRTPPVPGSGGGGSGGAGASGSRKATPEFGASPPGAIAAARRPLTEGLAAASGWNVSSQGLLPTQAQPQTSNENRKNTQETRMIDGEAEDGEEGGQEQEIERAVFGGTGLGTRTTTENREINPRDQHLATSIDARMDVGGAGGGGAGGGGDGAASPMRRPPPFHQPSSVEAIDQEEDDGDVEEGGEVEEAAHTHGLHAGSGGGGVVTRGGARTGAAPVGGGIGLVQRAASSIAQNGGVNAIAAAAGGVAAINRNNNFSAAIGFAGPLTQDFYGITATQEDIDAILGVTGGTAVEEDVGNAVADGEAREPSLPPAEPSRGPGIAILKGRDLSKNDAAKTTGGMEESDKGGEDHEEDKDGAEVQTSPEKPVRQTRRRGADDLSAGGDGDVAGPVQGIVYTKKRKTNPTKIVPKRTTRAAAAAAAAAGEAAALTGSTAVSLENEKTTGNEEGEGQQDEDMDYGNAGFDHLESMPPPPDVPLHPALAKARNMPTPRGATPAAELPSRALAARQKLHNLIRQRQMRNTASPSAAGGAPLPAGVYPPAAAAAAGANGALRGGLRVAVQRPIGGAAVASGGGSGPNSIDYRTPMAGQTPVHSVHLAGGGGGAAGGRAYSRLYPQQQQRPAASVPGGSTGGGTSAIWDGFLQRRKRQQQQQQQ